MTVTFEEPSTESKVEKTYKARDITSTIGEYIGTDEIDSPKGKSFLHKFYQASETGKVSKNTFGVWGATVLNNEMQKVQPGQLVKIVKKETPKGKNYLNFGVYIGKKN